MKTPCQLPSLLFSISKNFILGKIVIWGGWGEEEKRKQVLFGKKRRGEKEVKFWRDTTKIFSSGAAFCHCGHVAILDLSRNFATATVTVDIYS